MGAKEKLSVFRRERPTFSIWVFLLSAVVLTQLFDIYTTYIGIWTNATREANPFMVFLIDLLGFRSTAMIKLVVAFITTMYAIKRGYLNLVAYVCVFFVFVGVWNLLMTKV